MNKKHYTEDEAIAMMKGYIAKHFKTHVEAAKHWGMTGAAYINRIYRKEAPLTPAVCADLGLTKKTEKTVTYHKE